MSKRTVVVTMLTLFVGILVWDALLYADQIPDNSISQIISSAAKSYPVVAFFVGFLFGFLGAHFFDTTTQKLRVSKMKRAVMKARALHRPGQNKGK